MGLSVEQVHSCTAAVHKIHAMKCTAPIIVYKKSVQISIPACIYQKKVVSLQTN